MGIRTFVSKIVCATTLLVGALSWSGAAPTAVTLPSWEGKQAPSGWAFTIPASVTVAPASGTAPSILTVDARNNPPGGMMNANINLPLDAVRGMHLEVTVDIRAKDVTKPAKTYLGIKSMLHVTAPNRPDTWDQANANGDAFPANYDWKTFSFRTIVPQDATVANLVLGLQDSTGVVDFRNLQVYAVRKIAVLPSTPATGPRYTGHGPGALRGVMISPGITADDIAVLKSWNVNLVRYQLLWNSFPYSKADNATPEEYDAWLDGLLAHVDSVMPAFKKAGIMVLLDMHTPPGGRDRGKVHRIFTDAKWQQKFVAEWEKIAQKYKNEKQVWGYDLVNEPVLGAVVPGVMDWHDLAEATAKKIRAIDPDHAIIVEPDPWGGVSSLAGFEPIHVPKVVYSVHMYDPGEFTHQGVLDGFATGPTYPGVIGGKQWDKEQIRRDFKSVADYAKAYNVAIYVGEFSAVRWANGADKYLNDVIGVMEENGWDWSYHAFREWQGWSPEVGEDKAVTTPSPTPTARLLALQSAFARNHAMTVASEK